MMQEMNKKFVNVAGEEVENKRYLERNSVTVPSETKENIEKERQKFIIEIKEIENFYRDKWDERKRKLYRMYGV